MRFFAHQQGIAVAELDGLTVRVPETITAARLVPADTPLPLKHDDGAVSVTVPRVQSHQAVVLEY